MTSCNCIFRFTCGFGASIQTCSSTWVLLWWEHSVQYITVFQAFSYTYPIQGYLSQQPSGYNHGQVANLSQGVTHRGTFTVHTHIHIHGQFGLSNWPNTMHVFGLWEAAVHRVSPCRHSKNIQNPHRKAAARLNPGSFYCGAEGLTTTPPYNNIQHNKYENTVYTV